jgi:hypothetical protein
MRRRAITILAASLVGGIALLAAGTSASTAARPGKPDPKLVTVKNCDALYDIGRTFSDAFTGQAGDLNRTIPILNAFASRSPAKIRPDFRVLASASSKIASALNSLHLAVTPEPTPQTVARMTQLANELDMYRVTQASANVGTWAEKYCPNYVRDQIRTAQPPVQG